MAKKKKTDALVVPVDAQAIVQASRQPAALTKPENLNELKRRREVYRAAMNYNQTIKGARGKVLEAAALQLRAEIQIGAILQEVNKGNDITNTTYEDFLQEQTITPSQANRWRDMGYNMAKKLKLKSLLDESLKFAPAFFDAFEEYVQDCAADPEGHAVPSYFGFVEFLHETPAARAKRHRLAVLVVFCRNIPFADAEALYQKIRTAEYLDVTQDEFDTLVWQPILDKRNLFQGQALTMNARDKAAKANDL